MKSLCTILILICFTIPLPGEETLPSPSEIIISLYPGVSLPLFEDSSRFNMGAGAFSLAKFKLPVLNLLYFEAGAGYSRSPLDLAPSAPVDTANLSFISPRAGVGIRYELFRNFVVGAHVHGGYFFSNLNMDITENTGSNPLLNSGVDISYKILPSFSLGVDASYRLYFGLSQDLLLSVGASYHIPIGKTVQLMDSQLKPYRELSYSDVQLNPVFPVFYKYYADNPFGKIKIKNEGKIPLEDVKVTVFVNQYMDNAHLSNETEFVGSGDEREIDLYALFNEQVLGISESTVVQINITVESTVAGERYGNTQVENLRLYDRNATTWEDDKRAAAFVSTKDPTVLKFSKNVTNMVKREASQSLNRNFLTALAVHEALRLYGVSYVIDPTTPFIEFHEKKMAVDYLQFPNQTLDYRAGDCDDLSILYCALLESVGIKTAFITIPGHIYMAFGLDITPQQAQERFLKYEDLIFYENEAWLPLEITVREEGFLKAWQIGAKQWRENQSKALFIPLRLAWETYEAVGFSGEVLSIQLPQASEVSAAYAAELQKFVDRELYPQVSSLQEKLAASQNDLRLINALGVLYARYGVMDQAEKQFRSVLEQREFVPALVNLGNIRFLQSDMETARNYYERAYSQQPNNAKVLLALAKVNFEVGRYQDVEEQYKQIQRLDPDLAQRFSFLDMKAGDSTARANEVQRLKEEVVWDEE